MYPTPTTRGRWVKAGLAVILAAGLGLTGCSGDDDEHTEDGSDAHATIDPVADDPAITAKSVATALFTWNPANQSSVWAIPANVAGESMTGELAAMTRDPGGQAAEDDTPDEWDGWAAAGARMQALITGTEVSGDGDEREVTATVEQYLIYPDGTRTQWTTREVVFELVADDERWKAESMQEPDAGGGKP